MHLYLLQAIEYVLISPNHFIAKNPATDHSSVIVVAAKSYINKV
jgi:hypothetical protein